MSRPDVIQRNKSLEMRNMIALSWKNEETRKARSKGISGSMRGNNNGRFRVGVKHTPEAIEKMRQSHKGQIPWNKGLAEISTANELARKSKEYIDWRQKVFERDDYTCQDCGERGGELHADHIKPFAYFPELRFELSNGRTLCKECHQDTPTYGQGAKSFKPQLP